MDLSSKDSSQKNLGNCMIFQISITQVVRNVRSWQTSELIASCWGCQQTQLNLDNWLICFPTLRQPKTMSVFGEETKTSSNDLIVHFYHHPYLFVSEKKTKQNLCQLPMGSPMPILLFSGTRRSWFEVPRCCRLCHVGRFGGPVSDPETQRQCETAQLPTHPTGKTRCKIGQR